MQTSISLLFLGILFFSVVEKTNSQHWDSRQSGSQAFSLSGASSTLKNEFSILNNPSTLSYNEGLLFGLAANQLYLTEGLNTIGLGISYSTKKIGLGLGIERFGDDILSKSRIKAGISHRIGLSSIGFGLTLFQDYVEGYGYTHFIGFEVSSFTQLTEKIEVSLIINNPIIYHLRWQEMISEEISVISGISYKFSSGFQMYLDFQKSSFRDFNARIGAVYSYRQKLFVYIGILTNPILHSFGLGYRRGKFEFQVGSSIHPSLGASGSGSILFKLNKENEKL